MRKNCFLSDQYLAFSQDQVKGGYTHLLRTATGESKWKYLEYNIIEYLYFSSNCTQFANEFFSGTLQ
jgi:hypothetical protein